MASTRTSGEREVFLAGAHIGVLAVARAARAPLTMPLWYDYSPGGDVLIMCDRDAVHARAIRDAGRFTMVVKGDQPPFTYVSVEGPVVSPENEVPPYEQALYIARRYLPDAEARKYLDSAYTPSRTRLIRMRPEAWLSNDHSGQRNT